MKKIFLQVYNYLLELTLRLGLKFKIPSTILFFLLDLKKPEIYSWVKLNQIECFVPNDALVDIFRPFKVRKPNQPKFIWDGSWDRKSESIDKLYSDYSIAYRSIKQIFLDGIHYSQCDEYLKFKKKIEETGSSVRANSLSELDHYFEKLLSLKASLETEGYKTKKELRGKESDEIGVFIDRNGQCLKAEDNFSGTHRFALAKVVGSPQVFVKIIAIHKIWAQNNLHSIIESLSTKEMNIEP